MTRSRSKTMCFAGRAWCSPTSTTRAARWCARTNTATRSSRRGATLGANCTIVCGVTIGEYAFVGAGAVVTRNVKPYALMAGVPARHVGWMSAHGARLDLPLTGNGEASCPETGRRYVMTNGAVSPQER